MDVLSIQKLLNSRGFNPGELDGVWGRRTMQAVRAFQKAHGLTPDGVVGPLTMEALLGTFGAPTTAPEEVRGVPLVWYEEALKLMGTRENKTRGASNAEIIKWAQDLDIDYHDDDIPWCGLFVAHCIGATLTEEQLPNNPLGARNWQRFGESCRPQRGAVLVFWREGPTSFKGHVGFYQSEDAGAYHVLGGNQSDGVNVARLGKNRLLAARWPRCAATLPGDVIIAAAANQPLSHNEA